ncbi:Lactate/malate dehydrogenase [Arcobacter nitrofigilis DSM 7299]|uniref:Lactate/malate dehydrogenase n=1 Tax=Arcobacter nitrofigilis (strain ATCC 33309 / DSM 7299 / CCUG 15893 / LMG 7604 / NCTC 12251 / CI) TaxID=572480 RepID=D5V655_ARCNC|nr:lactate dehydrogenase [Arcobacter nitrofigilis]ADG93222.1 Lactate/malate dehydrogenase [Arcobacter nitrofigilis DSM 7299]
MHTNKLVVIGAGHVGSYVLADAMKIGLFGKIGVIDILNNVAFGEAIDQAQATAMTYMNNIDVTSGGYEQCEDADIIVVAAGPSVIPDKNDSKSEPDRAQLTKINCEVIREVMTGITKYTKDAIIILITNPLDTMVYIAENEFDYPKGRVFGTGTMLDSARLRKVVADMYNIDPKSVTGYMMGEHGKTAFPVLSRLNIAGISFTDLNKYFDEKDSITQAEAIQKEIVSAAYKVMNGKGWTNAGVAQAAVTMAQAVLLDERSVYPTSTTLRGQYGHDGDVALSMPCIIGREGVIKQIAVSLNEWETKKLQESIDYIKLAMKDAKTGLEFLK